MSHQNAPQVGHLWWCACAELVCLFLIAMLLLATGVDDPAVASVCLTLAPPGCNHFPLSHAGEHTCVMLQALFHPDVPNTSWLQPFVSDFKSRFVALLAGAASTHASVRPHAWLLLLLQRPLITDFAVRPI